MGYIFRSWASSSAAEKGWQASVLRFWQVQGVRLLLFSSALVSWSHFFRLTCLLTAAEVKTKASASRPRSPLTAWPGAAEWTTPSILAADWTARQLAYSRAPRTSHFSIVRLHSHTTPAEVYNLDGTVLDIKGRAHRYLRRVDSQITSRARVATSAAPGRCSVNLDGREIRLPKRIAPMTPHRQMPRETGP